jgi:DNA replication protein DnaC
LLIGGPTGTGKSWLACALGHKACREGLSVLYRRAPRLFAELATARGEGRLPRMLAALERTRLLIIDEECIGHGGHAEAAQALGQRVGQHRLSFQW